MSPAEVYQQIEQMLHRELHPGLSRRTMKRVVLMVTGMLNGECSSPSRMAEAVEELGLETAQVESIERRIRRSENDPRINYQDGYAPFVRAWLGRSQMQEILLILDPTSQAEHVVMVSVNAWYRGRSLPLAWTTWPGNVPLKGERFWTRIEALLQEAQALLPPGLRVTILADRAFGSPAFTDRVAALGWHWVVRVVEHTHCRDRMGREHKIQDLVHRRGDRRKLSGQVFKKAGWRDASVVAYWGHRHAKPLLLVTDLPPAWDWIALYRHRYPIEATFRDYKSYGWCWEQGQVRNLDHLQRLLVVMALATCLTLLLGASFASQLLATPPSGKRHTRPYFAKRSLFRLGLRCWRACFHGNTSPPFLEALPDWQAPNWSTQYLNFQNHPFVFA